MGVLHICRKLRYPLKPSFLYCTCLSLVSDHTYSVISSTGYPFLLHNFSSLASKSSFSSEISNGSILSFQFGSRNVLRYNCDFRLFSSSVVRNFGENEVSSSGTSGIIDIIKGDGSDMESRLDLIGSNLSRWSIIEILHILNVLKVPALRFFEWIRDVHPNHSRNSDICSLMIANCGQLGDYATMLSLLKDYRTQKICLSEKAFGFLPISSRNDEATKESIKGVVGVLDEVGGSCRNSGIHSLLEILCSSNLFDLAKFVIEITERKVSYYCILVKNMCKQGQFKDTRSLFEEMRQIKCDPDSKTYNYLISSLFKQGRIDDAFSVFEEMLDRGCFPDLVTYEILIYFGCRCGRSDQAVMYYNQLVSRGIKPRLSTHNAFVRGYFVSQRFEDAYRYVIDTAAEDKYSAQEIYNVLASLHVKHGDLLVAHNLLEEMIGRGLKPKHSVFLRATKRLRKTGKAKFADNLKARYYSQDVG